MFVEIALRLITTARLSGASSCKIKNCGGGGVHYLGSIYKYLKRPNIYLHKTSLSSGVYPWVGGGGWGGGGVTFT